MAYLLELAGHRILLWYWAELPLNISLDGSGVFEMWGWNYIRARSWPIMGWDTKERHVFRPSLFLEAIHFGLRWKPQIRMCLDPIDAISAVGFFIEPLRLKELKLRLTFRESYRSRGISRELYQADFRWKDRPINLRPRSQYTLEDPLSRTVK